KWGYFYTRVELLAKLSSPLSIIAKVIRDRLIIKISRIYIDFVLNLIKATDKKLLKNIAEI
ncbi:MAG: hypothetical protein MUO21_05065, partial [Nitrososphaeraceae archaeon]|nr:hypothetical protein [Nitrososphaeraceae archaeon]